MFNVRMNKDIVLIYVKLFEKQIILFLNCIANENKYPTF